MKKINNLLIVVLLVVLVSQVSAQKKNLTFNQVFYRQGESLTTRTPNIRGWSDIETDNYIEKRVEQRGEAPKLLLINAETTEESVFIDYAEINKDLPNGFRSEAAEAVNKYYNGFIFNQDNDLYYFDSELGQLDRITNDKDIESNPTFSPNERMILFTKNNNMYVYLLDIKSVVQLTKDGSDVILNGYSSWVYMEEILGRRTHYKAFWWSPNNDKVAFLRFDDSPVPKFPIYRADGVHGELEWERYPKSGDPNPNVKLGIIDLELKQTTWIDSNNVNAEYVAFPQWSPDGSKLFYQTMNREQDNLKIYYSDVETGETKKVYEETQSTWVEWIEDLTFLKNSEQFVLRSDRQGWRELYLYDYSGKEIKKLVDVDWNVTKILMVDEENDLIYFEGTGENSTELHLFTVDLKGSEITKLTEAPGLHSITLSMDASYYLDRFSNVTTPTQLNLYKTGSNELIRNIGDSKAPALDAYNLGKVELFTVPNGEGQVLPVKWFLPPDFDSEKKYPVMISIYGGPDSKTVRNSWGYSTRPYYYASKGIIYMEIDHRGSGHFSKEVTGQMHKNLGYVEMTDYIAIVKWLKELGYIDENKIGISGYSYGGYVTCMALTYGADYFTHGIAGGSVVDWHLYDNVYTERYMEQPKDNPKGYDFASVLTHVDKYKGKLLITHGTMDDNVHMQNSLQLIDELENKNKKFEMMFYPNSRHGVGFPKYFHSMELSADFWFRNFLGKTLDQVIEEES